MNEALKEFDRKMEKSIGFFEEELATIRAAEQTCYFGQGNR
jgi:ribosome recycling factor